jgi:hypothetical protein
MSNLMNTAEGRAALLVAQRWLLERRMSRFFKRNTAAELGNYFDGQGFHLENMLADLNVAHDDEIIEIYRLLGAIGVLNETVADVTYYVNATTGSDSEGDGGATSPYASLWFLSNLPKTIAHKVQIVIETDITETGLDIVIDQTFKGDGCLSFIGSGAPTVVSGPYTVAALTDLYNSAGSVVQATTPIGGSFEQRFLRVLTATNPQAVSKAVPISSTPDVDKLLCRRLPIVNLQAGDTFDICVPSHKLEVRTITVNAQGMSHRILSDDLGARVSFINLKIAVFDTDSTYETIKIDSTIDTVMSFCTIENLGKFQINSNLNRISPIDTGIEAIANCGVNNWVSEGSGTPNGCGITSITSAAPANYTDVIIGKNANVQFIHTADTVRVDRSTVSLQYFGAGKIEAFYSNGWISWGVIYGTDGNPDAAAIDARYCDLLLSSCALIDTKHGIRIEGEAKLALSLVGADATYGSISDYGLWVNGMSRAVLQADPAALSGTIGDISFNTVNPAQTPAFPAVYAQATDSQGSLVKRLSV